MGIDELCALPVETLADRDCLLFLWATFPQLWDVLALTPEEMHDPDAYLLHMRDDTHQPLTFQANRRLWERVCAAINVYGKTPHCFRHPFATRAYRAGGTEESE